MNFMVKQQGQSKNARVLIKPLTKFTILKWILILSLKNWLTWKTDLKKLIKEFTAFQNQNMKHVRNVKTIFDEVFGEKLDLDNIYIERVHRVKRGEKFKSTKSRTILCNLLFFKEKERSWKWKEIEKYEHFHRWRFLSQNDGISEAALGRSKRTS